MSSSPNSASPLCSSRCPASLIDAASVSVSDGFSAHAAGRCSGVALLFSQTPSRSGWPKTFLGAAYERDADEERCAVWPLAARPAHRMTINVDQRARAARVLMAVLLPDELLQTPPRRAHVTADGQAPEDVSQFVSGHPFGLGAGDEVSERTVLCA